MLFRPLTPAKYCPGAVPSTRPWGISHHSVCSHTYCCHASRCLGGLKWPSTAQSSTAALLGWYPAAVGLAPASSLVSRHASCCCLLVQLAKVEAHLEERLCNSTWQQQQTAGIALGSTGACEAAMQRHPVPHAVRVSVHGSQLLQQTPAPGVATASLTPQSNSSWHQLAQRPGLHGTHGWQDPPNTDTDIHNRNLLQLTSAFRLGFVQSLLLQHTTDLRLLGLALASACLALQSAADMMLYMVRHCLRCICEHTGSQVTSQQAASTTGWLVGLLLCLVPTPALPTSYAVPSMTAVH
jgi:hypothetical protein